MKSNYAVNSQGKLVYSNRDKDYTVWGISEFGFVHGAGSYVKRYDHKNVIQIDTVPTEEIEKYYRLLDKFWGQME